MKTRIFYSFNTTSQSRDCDIISLGLTAVIKGKVCKTGEGGCACMGHCKDKIKTFYSEFTDFNLNKCDEYIKENVIAELCLENQTKVNKFLRGSKNDSITGDIEYISEKLKDWLSQFESVEFWGNTKELLIDLIAHWELQKLPEITNGGSWMKGSKQHKISLPKHLPNINSTDFFDLSTLFKLKGIDVNVSKEVFSEINQQIIPLPFSEYDKSKHNSLWKSYVNYLCYEKLIKV
jgi:hypothetical protein